MILDTPHRPYRMKARAEKTARTGQAILLAAVELWREKDIEDITLQDIADRSGVTVQTVLRRYGSKEGVIEACINADIAEVETDRAQIAAGDLDGALDYLMEHYERDGDAVLRTLTLETKSAAARRLNDHGRRVHRAWCARVFACYLPPVDSPGYAVKLDAIVAVTDVYLWKLIRRDLGRSFNDTRQVLSTLLNGLAV